MLTMNTKMKVYGLTKLYGTDENQVKALNNVNLELEEGEIVIIMGPSGSGKSTLLHILGGLEEPTTGRFFIEGKEVQNFHKEPEASKFRRDKIGFVFQFFNLLSALSAEENIALPLILAGKSKKEINSLTVKMLQLVGLHDRKNHKPSELSGGQQQRVALARALIHNPSILLADEPTGNLDSKTSEDILSLLTKMRDELNQSIIIVTHDPMVATYGDRVLLFRDGEVVHEYKNNKQENRHARSLVIMEKLRSITEASIR
jgi:putative ABC transport system ATP-binding protein